MSKNNDYVEYCCYLFVFLLICLLMVSFSLAMEKYAYENYDIQGYIKTHHIDKITQEEENLVNKFDKNTNVNLGDFRGHYLNIGIKDEKVIWEKIIEDITLYNTLLEKYYYYNIKSNPLRPEDLEAKPSLLPKEIMLLKYRNILTNVLTTTGTITQTRSLNLSLEELERLANELLTRNNLAFTDIESTHSYTLQEDTKPNQKGVNKELGVFYRKEIK